MAEEAQALMVMETIVPLNFTVASLFYTFTDFFSLVALLVVEMHGASSADNSDARLNTTMFWYTRNPKKAKPADENVGKNFY